MSKKDFVPRFTVQVIVRAGMNPPNVSFAVAGGKRIADRDPEGTGNGVVLSGQLSSEGETYLRMSAGGPRRQRR